MRIYCLALTIILLSIVSGESLECNGINASSLNNQSSIMPAPPQELAETNATSPNDNQAASLVNSIDITSEVHEVDSNTSTRFGVGKKEPAKQEMYKITVHNSGSVPLSNVVVSAEMAEGMRFESTRYYEENRGRLDVTRVPIEFKDGVKTKLTWDIGILGPEEIKSIILEAYQRPDVENWQIDVNVTGNAPDNTVVRDAQSSAEIRECEFRDSNTGQPCAIPSETCKEVCPDWTVPQ